MKKWFYTYRLPVSALIGALLLTGLLVLLKINNVGGLNINILQWFALLVVGIMMTAVIIIIGFLLYLGIQQLFLGGKG